MKKIIAYSFQVWILSFLLGIDIVKAEIASETMAIIINTRDKVSQQVGLFYQKRRNIAAENVIFVSFEPGQSSLSAMEFNAIKQEVDRKIPKHIQAQVLTWTVPYKVDCMSITSAFTFGFNKAYCSKKCGITKSSPYYNSDTLVPYTDFGIRPTMQLAATDIISAKQLIDNGVKSDSTFPTGTGYLVSTSDKNRNVRDPIFKHIVSSFPKLPRIERVEGDFIKNKSNVLFYFTGINYVEHLATLKFLPGAIADHLTSFGGVLTGSKQMPIINWLNAGVTGSYGTVSEPCNYVQKFPNPAIVIKRYVAGETLLESYWKSVAWPGQGLFIGEPLASPFKQIND